MRAMAMPPSQRASGEETKSPSCAGPRTEKCGHSKGEEVVQHIALDPVPRVLLHVSPLGWRRWHRVIEGAWRRWISPRLAHRPPRMGRGVR